MNVAWHGVFPAITTQFASGQELDIPGTLAHLDRLMAAGIHGVIAMGTVGENCSLEAAEKQELLRAMVVHVAGRMPVLTGVAETTTRQACRYAAAAEQAGADGLMVLPAMVYKADASEAMYHFRQVARATSLPILVYNNPVAYRVDLTTPEFVALADEPNLVAIKESSENPRRITELRRVLGDRYILFCGVDDLVVEAHALGATGWVAGLVNAYPEETMTPWNLLQRGDLFGARAVYQWFQPLLQLDTLPKLVQCIKLAASVRGLGSETVREPRLMLAGAERERVLGIIHEAEAARQHVRTLRGVAQAPR